MENKNSKDKCYFKGCNNKSENECPLELEGDKSVRLPFCKYHSFIILGGYFKAVLKDDNYEVVGPFESVGLIEQVIASKELVSKK